jgi:hypothetical protein
VPPVFTVTEAVGMGPPGGVTYKSTADGAPFTWTVTVTFCGESIAFGPVIVRDSVYVPTARFAVDTAIRIGMQAVTGPPVQVASAPGEALSHDADEVIDRFSDPSPMLNALRVCAGGLSPCST